MSTTIELSVTHEIVIDGEKSWIKYGISTEVEPHETYEIARQRASEHVNEGVLATVRETVHAVREVTT